MNDEDLVPAAYRVILNLVIPPLRAKKLDDVTISWPCCTRDKGDAGVGADWTAAAFYFKRKLAFVIWCDDQNVMIGLPILKFRTIIMIPGLKEIFREPIADPRCHVKILDCIINLILNLRNKPSK